MLKDFEFFHGVVFARLFHASACPIAVARFRNEDNASYVLNHCTGIYVKYSAKRMPPWHFSFHKRHQDEIAEMRQSLRAVFLLLVCNDDGIVALTFDELKMILDENHGPVEWISATRSKRRMYAIAGSDGRLEFKVGMQDFPNKIVAALGGLEMQTKVFDSHAVGGPAAI
jgi:hypothetical protein